MIEANTSQTEADAVDILNLLPVIIITCFFATLLSILLGFFKKKQTSEIEVKIKKKGMITYE